MGRRFGSLTTDEIARAFMRFKTRRVWYLTFGPISILIDRGKEKP